MFSEPQVCASVLPNPFNNSGRLRVLPFYSQELQGSEQERARLGFTSRSV